MGWTPEDGEEHEKRIEVIMGTLEGMMEQLAKNISTPSPFTMPSANEMKAAVRAQRIANHAHAIQEIAVELTARGCPANNVVLEALTIYRNILDVARDIVKEEEDGHGA